jgi:Ca2+-dependent lipid-binding protein
MEDKPLGILRVHVKRGINLAIRDATTSDPYVVITLANQVWFMSFLIRLCIVLGLILW